MSERIYDFRRVYKWDNVENPITDEEVRQWIVYLRSGEYRQTEGALEEEVEGFIPDPENPGREITETYNGFCCLGVLGDQCKLLDTVVDSGAGTLLYYGNLDGETNEVHVKLPDLLQNSLAELNDGGQSFGDIALILEAGFFGGNEEILEEFGLYLVPEQVVS